MRSMTKATMYKITLRRIEVKSEVIRSMSGLGEVLLQKGILVTYTSKTFTPPETGYSNIERELLSVVFGLERLPYYVFWSKSKIQSDHKPLIPIWKKSIGAVSP